jgi:hypothetical protein
MLLPALLAITVHTLSSAPQSELQNSEIAAKLMGHFETVVYSTPRLIASIQKEKVSGSSMLAAPFGRLLEVMEHLEGSSPGTPIPMSRAVFMGARDFQPPAGIGALEYQFCFLIHVSPGQDLGRLFRTLPSQNISGLQIYRWAAKYAEAPPQTFLGTLFLGKYLLIANNPEDLVAVTRNLSAVSPSSPSVPARQKPSIRSSFWRTGRTLRHPTDPQMWRMSFLRR